MSLNSTRYVDYVFRFSLFSTKEFNDFFDRLSSKFCCLLSVLAAVTLVIKFHYFKSVSCYTASINSLTFGLQDFVDSFCLGHGFIVLPNRTQSIPTDLNDLKILDANRIQMYIWMPYVLMVQALFFYLPGFMWRSIYNGYCRRDVGCVIKRACDSVKMFGGGGEFDLPEEDQQAADSLLQLQKPMTRASSALNNRTVSKVPENAKPRRNTITTETQPRHNTTKRIPVHSNNAHKYTTSFPCKVDNDDECCSSTAVPLAPLVIPTSVVRLPKNDVDFRFSQFVVMEELAAILEKVFLRWQEEAHDKKPTDPFRMQWIRNRFSLPVCYSLVKVIYLINLIGHIFYMTLYLHVDIASLFSSRTTINHSSVFPLRAFCLVKTPQFGAQYNHIVAQCALPLNQFNEKFTQFLALWYSVVLAASIAGFFRWLHRLHSGCLRLSANWVSSALTPLADIVEPQTHNSFTTFVDTYLRQDGLFLLYMIRHNADQAVFHRLFHHLWTRYHQVHTPTQL